MDNATGINMSTQTDETNLGNLQTSEEVYRASLAAILQQNIGLYVICEFLIGTVQMQVKDGILFKVGVNFITLFQEEENRYIMCDLYSLKFVTIYNSKTKPRNLRNIRRDF